MKAKGKNFKLGDQIGQTGLEQSLDSLTRGRDGISYVQVDARGRVQNAANSLISYIGLKNVEPKIGNNVILTLDKDLQKAAFDAFFRDDKLGVRKGGLVALNIKCEVLAWASNPSFDPNLFQTGISSDIWKKLNNNRFKPLTDKVAQGTYSPGSVFKPFVGLAALHLKEITKYTKVESPGQIFFGGRSWHDSRRAGHGIINLSEALEVSGNVFFYKLGMSLGVDAMSSVISRIGLGKNTGIKYIRESKGLLPTTEWKRKNRNEPWQRGEDLNYAIGQGAILTTMLQLARGYLTIATKGKVIEPILVKEILTEKGRSIKSFEPRVIEDLTKASDLNMKTRDYDAVIEGLIKVAHGTKGTARYRSSRKFLMAGKTGTAQVRNFSSNDIYSRCEDRPEKDRHHGFFVGFAPAEKPEIVVAGLAIHGCHGASGAAPMVTDLLTAYMKKHHPELFESSIAKNNINEVTN
jgi:penicillin-binding protein 2